ncbi:RNA polymerase sigma factor [Thalassobacillus sp. CUG 92003]|uniref:RNA polymerase sigma factor n=1 Tax=Thalassobacillus sp. CUG 92003 TaxID=2736641 RepID=UPI0015E635DC|nr:sigma-70 family RNA polymerase sigma factor [Thalassobacillus sp. CUG 92003]
MSRTDKELYALIADGDKGTLEEIYDKYEKLLYSFAIKLSGDATLAEEVLQEVFIKIWTHKAVYQEKKGKFSSWIVTVTRYTCIDLIRKRKDENVSLEEETDIPEEQDPSTEDLAEWREQGQLIRQAIRNLAEEQTIMVDLFYFKGLTQREIAEECNLPLGTVKGRIRLALKHLNSELSNIQEKGGVHDV